MSVVQPSMKQTRSDEIGLTARALRRISPSRLSSLLRSPWMVIAVGAWVQCFTGGTYDFSIYSARIKDSLQLTQEALDSISFSKDIGANVGVISGLIYDYVPTWIVFACAAVLALVGNVMMWLSITLRVSSPPLWLACFYMLLAANSQTFTNTGVIVTSVKIFPTCRGTVVGLMKGCVGISGAVLVQLYLAAFGSNREQVFPLLIACVGTLVCVAGIFIIRPLPPVISTSERKWLNACMAIVLSLAIYLLAVIVLGSFVNLGQKSRIAVFCGILIFLLSPLWVAFKAEHSIDESSMVVEGVKDEYVTLPGGPNVDKETGDSLDNANHVEEPREAERGDDISLLNAMRTLDFWFLFLASACGMGSGLTVINNLSQLGSSLGYSTSEISNFVSLWSIWNFLGRFGGGHVSELMFRSKGVPRPIFIVMTLGVMALGHLMIAFAFSNALYIGPVIVGTCYGAQWSLMPTIASELFGLKNFGAIFNTIAIASPVGSFILSVKVTGYFYDLEAERQADSSLYRVLTDSLSCDGAKCFRLSFLTMAGVCILGASVNVILVLRTRQFYRSLQQRMAV